MQFNFFSRFDKQGYSCSFGEGLVFIFKSHIVGTEFYMMVCIVCRKQFSVSLCVVAKRIGPISRERIKRLMKDEVLPPFKDNLGSCV